jgi:outer membrane protein assembly factor BamB
MLSNKTLMCSLAAFASLTLMSQPARAINEDAGNVRINAAHTGQISMPDLVPPLAIRWQHNFGYPVSNAIIAGGRVFAVVNNEPPSGSWSMSLYAFDASTGNVDWGPVTLPGGTGDYEGLVYDNGAVYVGTTGYPGFSTYPFTKYSATTGAQLWQINLSGSCELESEPVCANGYVYVTAGGGMDTSGNFTTMLYKLSESNGAVAWTDWFFDNGFVGAPAIGATDGYQWFDNYEFGFDLGTGSAMLPSTSEASGFQALYNGDLFVTNPNLAELNPMTGSTIQTYGVADQVPTYPAFDNGSIFWLPNNPLGDLQATNISTGATEWTANSVGYITSPVIVNGIVYVGDLGGNFNGIDESTGALAYNVVLPGEPAQTNLLGPVDGTSPADVNAGDGIITLSCGWTEVNGSILNGTTLIAIGGQTVTPTISSKSPTSAVAGSPFTLTINGSNFLATAMVTIGSTALTPTSVTSSTITVSVPASAIPVSGTAPITVTNSPTYGGTASTSISVLNAAPTITSISPVSAPAGTASTLTVNGTGFYSNSVIVFNGTSLTTTFVSSIKLTATISASSMAIAGAVNVDVATSGAGTSNAKQFAIDPVITSLSPTGTYAGHAAFTLTVNGVGFKSGSLVEWNGSALATTYVSSTQLKATVPASLVTSTGTASITVVSSSAISSASSFSIVPAATTVPNFSFETPVTTSHINDPAGASWTFANGTGTNSGICLWSVVGGTAPNGTQVAYVQGTSSITQTLTGFIPGISYKISTYANYQSGYTADLVDITVNGATVGTFTPSAIAYNVYSATFTATSSSETIGFVGATTGTTETDIDAVSVTGN